MIVMHFYELWYVSKPFTKILFQLTDSEKILTNGVKGISPEQEELIHRLVYFQNEYEHPSEEDVKRIVVSLCINGLF